MRSGEPAKEEVIGTGIGESKRETDETEVDEETQGVKRRGEACRKVLYQFAIRSEGDIGGRARMTRDKEIKSECCYRKFKRDEYMEMEVG